MTEQKPVLTPELDEKIGFIAGWGPIGRFLGVSKKTAFRWHRQYGMPVYRIGDTPLVIPAILIAWVQLLDEERRKRGLYDEDFYGQAGTDADNQEQVFDEVEKPC
jgi:hypothetical protein